MATSQPTIAIRVVATTESASRMLKEAGENARTSFQILAQSADRAAPSLKRVEDATDSLSRKAQANFQNLGFQVNDFVTQVASGTGVLQAAAQQGAQVAQLLGPWGAILGGAAAAVAVLAGNLLTLNTRIEETPDRIGPMLDAFEAIGKKAEEQAAKIRGLTDAQRALLAQAAAGEKKDIRQEQADLRDALIGELTERVDTRTRGELAGRFTGTTAEFFGAELEVQTQVAETANRFQNELEAAVKSGNPDQVAAVLAAWGLGDDDNTRQLLDATKRLGAAEVVRKTSTGEPSPTPPIPTTQGFGDGTLAGLVGPRGERFAVGELGGLAPPDTAELQRQIQAEEQATRARQQAAERLRAQRESVLNAIFGASKDETPDQAIERVNRQLDVTLEKLAALRAAPGGRADPKIAEAEATARRNAEREIAGIRERAAAAGQRQERRDDGAAREAENRQRVLQAVREETAGALRLAEAKRAELQASRDLASGSEAQSRLRVAQAAREEVEAAQRLVDVKRAELATARAPVPDGGPDNRQRVAQAEQEVAAASRRLVEAKRAELEASRGVNAANDNAASISQKVQREIESERRVREASRTLKGQELEQYKREEAARVAALQQMDELTAAQKRQNDEREKAVRVQQLLLDLATQAAADTAQGLTGGQVEQLTVGVQLRELGATPEEIVRGMNDKRRAAERQEQDRIRQEQQRANDAYVQQQVDVLLEPWRQLANQISGIAAGIFDEFLATGRVSLERLATDVADGLRGIVSGFLGNLVTLPLNQAVASLLPALNQAFASPNGSVLGAFGNFTRQNPLTAGIGAGALGLTLGNTFTAMTGGNQVGSSLGGLGGAALGAGLGSFLGPLGMAAGAGLGGLFGGALGGLFGGGENNLGNDRARLQTFTQSGFLWEDSNSSPENRRAVHAFAQTVDDITRALESLGGTVRDVELGFGAGNKSGLEFQGQRYANERELTGAVIRFIGQNTEGLSRNQQLALQNTQAGSVGELTSDLAFAEQLDRFRRNLGPLGSQLADLEISFRSMQTRAAELGLETDGLTEAYRRQVREIKDGVRDQIAAFTGSRTGPGQAIDQIRQQAEDLTQAARDVGVSASGIAAAAKRQIADIKEQVRDQVEAFRGNRTSYGQAIRQVREQAEELIETARDVGVSTAGIAAAANRQVREIRDAAREQVDQFRNAGLGSSYREAFQALRDQYEEALQVAREMGFGTAGLNASLQRQQRDLRRQAVREIEGFVQPDLVNRFTALTDEFERLKEVANDVGRGVGDLTDAYRRQKKELLETAEAQVRNTEQSLREQTRGLQDVFDQFLDPLKQALGPFGIGQGIVAPTATVEGGIELFREQLARARQGDVEALQGIIGTGQSTIQAARQFGASGKAFTDVFLEVNRGLAEVQSRLQDRQIEAMRGIQAVGQQTLDELVRLRREAIQGVREDLEGLRSDLRLLRERMVA